MCEFHLKGNCFHPNRVIKGSVAIPCTVHSCGDCTDKEWQEEQIQDFINYYKELAAMSNLELPTFAQEKPNPKRTEIFG